MNKKISLGLAIALMAISAAITFILTSFFSLQSYNRKVMDVNEKARKYSSLELLDSYVRENYYGKIDENKLSDGILKGYVSGIGDKYSRFLTEDEYITEQNNNSGNVVGLGFTLSEDESGYICISEILPESPATESGIVEGDMITFVEGVDVKELGFIESVEAMRGTEGSPITLTIRRGGVDKAYTFIRQSIEVVTVTGEMLSSRIGYIKISGFKQNTPEQFIDVLERLSSNGAQGFIFDLRGNSSELVSVLEQCLDPLLPEGVIATAEYTDGSSETVIYSDESAISLPMSVIVNENTAGAAELFAAALRDFGGASVIGTQTAGKGTMQTANELISGGAVILTVAELRTEISGSFNTVGITPDVPAELADDGTDTQFNAAVELMTADILTAGIQ